MGWGGCGGRGLFWGRILRIIRTYNTNTWYEICEYSWSIEPLDQFIDTQFTTALLSLPLRHPWEVYIVVSYGIHVISDRMGNFKLPQNRWYKTHQITKTKYFRLVLQLSLPNLWCQVLNKEWICSWCNTDTSEWSTIYCLLMCPYIKGATVRILSLFKKIDKRKVLSQTCLFRISLYHVYMHTILWVDNDI